MRHPHDLYLILSPRAALRACALSCALSCLISCAESGDQSEDPLNQTAGAFYTPPTSGVAVVSDTPPPPPSSGAMAPAPCVEDLSNPDGVMTCPPEPPPEPPPPVAGQGAPMCDTGSLRGIACSPSGDPIVGAQVRVRVTDCMGVSREVNATTDEQGRYDLVGLPVGMGELTISAGSFEHTTPVTITTSGSGGDYEQTCIGARSTKIAVFTGAYDSIEHIISALGFEYDTFCGDYSSFGARNLLDTPSRLSTYDVLFINCGSSLDLSGSADGQRLARNLRSYVEGGGSVYASDLSAGLVAAAYPELARFEIEYDNLAIYSEEPCCTCGANCPAYCDAQPQGRGQGEFSACVGVIPGEQDCQSGDPYLGNGVAGVVSATIRNANLSAAVGHSDLSVTFDLDEWVRIVSVSPSVEVLVDAGGPLMIRYTSSAGGRLIYTSFHNERQASQDLQKILRALVFEL